MLKSSVIRAKGIIEEAKKKNGVVTNLSSQKTSEHHIVPKSSITYNENNITIITLEAFIAVDKDKIKKEMNDNINRIKKEYKVDFQIDIRESNAVMISIHPPILFILKYNEGYLLIYRGYTIDIINEREIIGLLLTIMADSSHDVTQIYRVYDNLKLYVSVNISRVIMKFYE